MNCDTVLWPWRVSYSMHIAIWICWLTGRDETCPISGITWLICMSLVTYQWVMSHISMSHVTYQWVMTHISMIMSHSNDPIQRESCLSYIMCCRDDFLIRVLKSTDLRIHRPLQLDSESDSADSLARMKHIICVVSRWFFIRVDLRIHRPLQFEPDDSL